jgi:hypothetical protein
MTTFTWIGGSRNWDSGSSWTPTGIPTATDTATINAAGTYAVTINSADVAQSVILDSAGARINDFLGGSLTVGGTLGIDTGTYDLLGGTLTATHIRIQHGGLLEGSGTIGATVTNNSVIEVSSGGLDFQRQVNSLPSKTGTESVSGDALLEFDKKVFASQHIDFGAGGGRLGLTDPNVFFGHIVHFASDSRDLIGLAGAWTFVSLSHPTTATTDLVLGSSGHIHTFVFAGIFTDSNFDIAPTPDGNTTIKPGL